jgi:hypothetical protein
MTGFSIDTKGLEPFLLNAPAVAFSVPIVPESIGDPSLAISLTEKGSVVAVVDELMMELITSRARTGLAK